MRGEKELSECEVKGLRVVGILQDIKASFLDGIVVKFFKYDDSIILRERERKWYGFFPHPLSHSTILP